MLQDQELKDLQQEFDTLDKNKDGFLSPDELTDVLDLDTNTELLMDHTSNSKMSPSQLITLLDTD